MPERSGPVVPAPVTAFAILVLMLGLIVAVPLNRGLRSGLAAELIAMEGAFEERTGFTLHYESLSPSVLAGIEARNLVIGTADGRKLLSARRVSLRFDIGAFLSNREIPFVTSVVVEGADARLSSADLDKVLALFKQGGSAGTGPLRLPAIRFEARDLSLDLPDFEGMRLSLAARRIGFDARRLDPSLGFDGTIKGRLDEIGAFSATLGVSGSFSRDLDAARLRVATSIKTNDFTLRRQDFDLSLGKGVLELRKARDSSPVDIYGRVDLGTKETSVTLGSDSFRPDSLFSPTGRLSYLAPWFGENWSASLVLSARNFDLSTLDYRGKLSGNLPASIFGEGWSVSADAAGDLHGLSLREARASGPDGSFSLTGKASLADLSLDGRLVSEARLLGGRLPVKAVLDFKGSSGDYRILGSDILVDGVAFGTAALDLNVDSKSGSIGYRLSLGLPEPHAGSGFAPKPGPPSLNAEGSLLLGKSPLVECSLAFDILDGASLAPLLSDFLDRNTAGFAESLALSGSLIVRSDLSHLSWSTTDLVLASRRFPGFRAELAASGSDLDFRLRSSNLSYRGQSAGLSGDLSIAGADMLSFSATLQYAGIPYNFQGNWVRDNLNVKGDYGLSVTAHFIDEAIIAGCNVTSLPIPLPGMPLAMTATANLRFSSMEDWSMALSRVSIMPTSLGGAVPGLAFSGVFGPTGGTLSSARLSDRISSVDGGGRLSWNADSLGLSLKFGTAPAENYTLDASLEAGRLHASLSFGSSPLLRFVKQRLSGAIDGKIDVDGPLDGLSAVYDISLRQGKFDDAPIELHLAGGLGAKGYSLKDGSVLWSGFRVSALRGIFDSGTGKGALSGSFASSLILPGSSFDFSADINSRVGEAANPLESLTDSVWSGATTNFAYGSMRSPRWPFVADLSSRGFFLKGGPGDDFVISFASDGSFLAKAAPPFPILLDLQGRVREGKIEAEAHGISIDMPILVALVGKLPVSFKGGKLTGDLMIAGPAADPEFSGALELVDCQLSMPGWISETAGPVTAPVVVDGKRMFLQAPSVPIMNSRFSLSFELDFEGWVPTGVKLGLGSLPSTRVPLETNILGVAIKGFAVPDITLAISGSVLSVKGKLALQNTDVVITPQTLAQSDGSGGSQDTFLDIDLGIETDRGVHFYFPSKDYPVIAGNVVPGNHLSVRYDQAKDDLSFKGEIDARGGDAFYIQRNFFLRSAKIVFNESSGKAFDPLVSMLAELRDSTAEGPITVTLRADNQPISVFKPSITSDPPKSEADIALILGQGLLALDESGGLNLGRVAIAGSEFVPQLNVTKAFESRVRDALNLDVLYFNSQAIQRWLFSLAGTGTQGLSTLSDYLKETNLFAGKYLSDSVFVHGSARLDADPLVPAGSLEIVSELGVDFETPFGLLQWTFQPQHPESLFVNDQSLSLSWRLPLK